MTVFWSLAAVMLMVALLFVLPPLLRKRKLPAISHDELNTGVIRAQLAELDTDLKAGKLDQAQYAAARTDLERELLYDLDTSTPEPREARSGRWATLLIIPALPLCAVLLYQLLGSGELIGRLQTAETAQPQTASQQATSINEMVAKLAERMRQQPDDLQGWVMLARSYTVMKRYPEAEAAYKNVLRLGGENADALTDYADAMVMATGGRFTDKAGALLTRALELDPDNIKGLWLAGHWKNQTGDKGQALDYWQRAAAQLPPGSEDASIIAQQISQVQAQLGIEATPALAAAAAPAMASPPVAADSQPGVSLQVHVELAPDLASAASPDDTVFIFARATQGPRMPLAIVRKQVRDLPVSVTLDDSMAMSPQMVLSKFPRVTVGARVSKSGGALPQSGDLQGMARPVDPKDSSKIELSIDSKVP